MSFHGEQLPNSNALSKLCNLGPRLPQSFSQDQVCFVGTAHVKRSLPFIYVKHKAPYTLLTMPQMANILCRQRRVKLLKTTDILGSQHLKLAIIKHIPQLCSKSWQEYDVMYSKQRGTFLAWGRSRTRSQAAFYSKNGYSSSYDPGSSITSNKGRAIEGSSSICSQLMPVVGAAS